MRRGLARAKRMLDAEFWSPWQSHAPMEPMNATVALTADSATVWAPTQGPQMAQIVLGDVLGIDPAKVTVNRTYLGGGFGRRLLADYIAQAALCAKAVGRPVKLIWHREEDFKQDVYRPGFLTRIRATTGANGLPQALHQQIVAPTILGPVSPVPLKAGDVDQLAVEGARELPYAIANSHVDYHMLQVPVPTMVWRTTGFGPNTFALESVIDELAAWTSQDPYRYRRRLLAHNRGRTCRARPRGVRAPIGARPQGPLPGHRFRGLLRHLFVPGCGALARGRRRQAAQGRSVADPGRVLDRDNAAANIEGGVIWGLTAALYSELTFHVATCANAISTTSRSRRCPTRRRWSRISWRAATVWAVSAKSARCASHPLLPMRCLPQPATASTAAAGARRRAHGLRQAVSMKRGAHSMARIDLTVNGAAHALDVDPDTPLSWVLRDHLGLTGTKFGCGAALCGACTVHVDGEAARACAIPVSALGDARVTTIEALGGERLHRLQQAWIDLQVPQCGYCQPGFLMAAAALLAQNPEPTDAEIEASITNLCRCGTYARIKAAIRRAAA